MTIKYTLGNIVGELPKKEYMPRHKFVVMVKGKRGALEFVLHSEVNTGIQHRDIVEKNLEIEGIEAYIRNPQCVGGGEIVYGESVKGTVIAGSSSKYGHVHPEICNAFGKLLSEKYGINYVDELAKSPSFKGTLSSEWNTKYGNLENYKK